MIIYSKIRNDGIKATFVSSGYKGATSANKRIGQKRRQKTVAWLLCGHMFLLCGAGPYVCIGWLWAWVICFYYAALGYMFLLVGCRRGAGPYVSIVCVYVYMYVCVYMCVYVCICVYVCVCVCVFIGLLHHSEGTCWRYRSSSN